MEGLGLSGLRSVRVREVQVMVCMVVVMISLRAEMGSAASMHYVGGSKISWAPNVNLSDWSSHETFYVGDWLYFGYEKHQFNVLEVNETNYEKCNDKDFISNVTRGAGRDVFQLTKAKTYYFLSSGGYCFGGLKVAIKVLRSIPPTPPSAPTSAASTSTFTLSSPLLLLLLLLLTTSTSVLLSTAS